MTLVSRDQKVIRANKDLEDLQVLHQVAFSFYFISKTTRTKKIYLPTDLDAMFLSLIN